MSKRYRPYLDTHLNLGFLGWETRLMSERFDMDAYEYIGLRWYFFKWGGWLRLYRPGKDRS